MNSLLKLIQEPLSVINKYEKTLREEERRKELISIAEEWMFNWRAKTVYGSAKSIAKIIAKALHAEYIEI